jgi:hypothetical protein
VAESDETIAAPQEEQNLAASDIAVPHDAQLIIVVPSVEAGALVQTPTSTRAPDGL